MDLLSARCMATLSLSKPRRTLLCAHTLCVLARAPPLPGATVLASLLERCLPAPAALQDSDPTVLFSSEVAAFEPLLCTSAVITWGSMQIWVVTSAGEGEKTSITGTVTTPACTPNR